MAVDTIEQRLQVELACGISIELGTMKLKEYFPDLAPESRVVVVVCGGSNVTSKMLCDWRNEYAYIEEETEARRRKSDSALGSETQSETGSVKDMDMGNVPSEYSKPIVIEGIEVECVECSG